MQQYNVTGMSCAACSARVEKAVSRVEGVTSCSVNLLTHSMGVEGDVTPDKIIEAVEKAGYGATQKGGNMRAHAEGKEEALLKDRETPALLRRLMASLVFLIVLMYFSMGHMMWNWPVPSFFEDNPVAIGLLQLLLAAIVMVINQRFFISGCKSLLHLAPNMDTLVALGSGAAFVYSTFALLMMTKAVTEGDMEAVMTCQHEMYFESAAMILTLITVGKMLEAHSKGKTTDAIKGLMKLAPKTAIIIKNGTETEVDISQVEKGDIFIVKPGENIPVDGVVVEGISAVNEAALTGESIPVDKEIGDRVSAATLNQSGFLKCEAIRVGEDTTLSQIIQMVSDASATKAPIAKIADKVSGIFVLTVIVIALITVGIWLVSGQSIGFSLARGISVLVISCPCALGLATPVAIMVGNGVGAKNGIMFKNAVALEETGRAQIVVLDKTGTITSGEPVVTDIVANPGIGEKELLSCAYSLERKSEHPLAKAITQYVASRKEVATFEVQEFTAVAGNGLMAYHHGSKLCGGNAQFIASKAKISEGFRKKAETLANDGKTPLFFAKNEQLLGMIAVADVIKEDSKQAVQALKNMGIHVVMLTGDNERTAEAIAKQAGVHEVVAGVMPEGKENVIKQLKEKGKVVMVGDGINDAPALTRADIGMAIGAGTDIAIDAADVVLMRSRLSDVPAAIRLSRRTLRNIHENLFWAFFYNIAGIPLAAGAYIRLFGFKLHPMFGAAAMSLSSFCVVTNALRLNFVDVHDTGRDKRYHRYDSSILEKEKEMEDMIMQTKTIKIEGMMCGHCEATVKKALEALQGVESAQVSHEKGTAVVELSAEVTDEELKNAVEEKDYTVTEIVAGQ